MALPESERLPEVAVYVQAREVLEREGIPFMVGGGHAVAAYGHRRATKDIDFILLAEHAEPALRALERERFFVRRSDPRWLYQAMRGEVLVDLVFASCTHRGIVPVTRDWLDCARRKAVAGHTFPVIAPEELIGQKILAQHEDRLDWWDAERLLADRRRVDWQRILRVCAIDPVKTLSFLLFVEARHPNDGWYPREVLR